MRSKTGRPVAPCAQAYDDAMHDRRTPAWWLARLELAIGIGLILVVGFLGWLATRPMIGDTDAITLGPLLVSSGTIVSIAALATAVVGLIWMIRIRRGPRDKPPRWRYRDH